ncbi:MAG: Gfo/Idh/MocA family oxidoreductase [Clostridiaceae bacterium]|nr:Gfo/Idh/MocA family oxidoreductase [Clostridiaceae bacterium]
MTVKLGVVGCGFISEIHSSAFAALKDKMEVVACCDLIIERAENMAAALGGTAFVTTDYRDLYGKIDAVLLALPHDLHHPIGIDFMKQGVHVLMEKPMAITEEECLELIQVAEEEQVKFMVAYIMRYHPQIVKLKEIIDEGTYGELFQMSIWTEQYTYLDPEWASVKHIGGGQFFSHGCHYVDLLLWFLGDPVKGAHMGTKLCTPWMEWEGTSNAIFEFEGNRLAYHFGTWGTVGTRHSYAIHAFFEKGMVECCLNEGKMILHKTRDLSRYFEKSDIEELIFECEPTSHLPFYELDHFADCVIHDREPLTSGATTLQGHRIIWRMYAAERRDEVADLRGLGLNDPWERIDGPWSPEAIAKIGKER